MMEAERPAGRPRGSPGGGRWNPRRRWWGWVEGREGTVSGMLGRWSRQETLLDGMWV